MNIRTNLRRGRPSRWVSACLMSLPWMGGCGESLPPPSDPSQARQILSTSLDAWKRGETAESLASAVPPVRVLDRQWSDGLALAGFELKGDGHPLGLNIQQAVTLQLRNPKKPKAKVVVKTVNYVVTTGVQPMIARQDIDD